MHRIHALSLLALMLAACATSYQPRGDGMMGYFDQPLDKNHWEIRFNAQRQTDWATIDQYLRRHASEVAIREGWGHYDISEPKHATISDPVRQVSAGNTSTVGVTYGASSQPMTPSPTMDVFQLPVSYRQGSLIITLQL